MRTLSISASIAAAAVTVVTAIGAEDGMMRAERCSCSGTLHSVLCNSLPKLLLLLLLV